MRGQRLGRVVAGPGGARGAGNIAPESEPRAAASPGARPTGAETVLPRVSVVVPSFNHARYLDACLRSVLAQSHPPVKLLVIDDGSSDGSPRVAERVLADAAFPAELMVRPNRGLPATLNEGFAKTQGELFAYLGSDDRWHPDRLCEAVRLMTETPSAALAFGPCYLIDAADRVLGVSRHHRPREGSRLVESLLRLDFVPPSPTVTLRRAAVEPFGWNESSRLEDYELYLRLAATGPFVLSRRALGYWRWHEGNSTWDCGAMLDEFLAAQALCAPYLGLGPTALHGYQTAARFRHAYHFLLAGDRRRAFGESLAHLSGAGSMWRVLDRATRLLLPLSWLGGLRRWRYLWYRRGFGDLS